MASWHDDVGLGAVTGSAPRFPSDPVRRRAATLEAWVVVWASIVFCILVWYGGAFAVLWLWRSY